MIRTPVHGRRLDDFDVGATYAHPWEVTIDAGMTGSFAASFLDASPVYASAVFARKVGFRDRPVHPVLLLDLGLSFSVHDVSEQAIAHLAYLDVRFPNPCYAGDTVAAWSTVLGKKASGAGDKGVVHVRTIVATTEGTPVCVFERKALIRGGSVGERPAVDGAPAPPALGGEVPRLPPPLRAERPKALFTRGSGAGYFEGFTPGDVICHHVGKTFGESEHMQLSLLLRNTHPIHSDEVYCREGGSFAGTRVVYGGLVLAAAVAAASRDVAGHALWEMGLDEGAHPSGVVAGDTIFAATKVLEARSIDDASGEVVVRLVGVKNRRPESILAAGADLFAPELGKADADRVPEKVVEITRRLLVPKR